jgi:hypothetical protein
VSAREAVLETLLADAHACLMWPNEPDARALEVAAAIRVALVQKTAPWPDAHSQKSRDNIQANYGGAS